MKTHPAVPNITREVAPAIAAFGNAVRAREITLYELSNSAAGDFTDAKLKECDEKVAAACQALVTTICDIIRLAAKLGAARGRRDCASGPD